MSVNTFDRKLGFLDKAKDFLSIFNTKKTIINNRFRNFKTIGKHELTLRKYCKLYDTIESDYKDNYDVDLEKIYSGETIDTEGNRTEFDCLIDFARYVKITEYIREDWKNLDMAKWAINQFSHHFVNTSMIPSDAEVLMYLEAYPERMRTFNDFDRLFTKIEKLIGEALNLLERLTREDYINMRPKILQAMQFYAYSLSEFVKFYISEYPTDYDEVKQEFVDRMNGIDNYKYNIVTVLTDAVTQMKKLQEDSGKLAHESKEVYSPRFPSEAVAPDNGAGALDNDDSENASADGDSLHENSLVGGFKKRRSKLYSYKHYLKAFKTYSKRKLKTFRKKRNYKKTKRRKH